MRRIAVLDAPSNLGLRPPTPTSVPGCAKAPGALRDHGLLRRLNARDAGCLTPPRYDPGDWRPGDGVCHAPEISSYSRRLADRIGAIIDQGEFPVILGGDCSIVLGSALAMHRLGEAVGGRIGLVFVDGHSDFRHPGNASYVGAAAGEDLALVTGRGQHDLAAMEGRRPYYRDIDVVVMGIRAQDEYRLDLQAAGIVTRPVPTLRVEGAARSAQWAKEQLVDCAGYWVHVDMDVLDPAVMPAVDAPEPGGIAFPELEILLAGLVESPHCLGVEITVFDPDYDPDGAYAEEITSTIVAGLKSAQAADARPDLVAARRDLATGNLAPGVLGPGSLGPGSLGPGSLARGALAASPVAALPLAEPPLAEPSLAEPPLAEPSLAEPSLAEPPLAEPSLAEPSLAEAPLAEPPLAEPPLAEPPLAEPSLIEVEKSSQDPEDAVVIEAVVIDTTVIEPDEVLSPAETPPAATPHWPDDEFTAVDLASDLASEEPEVDLDADLADEEPDADLDADLVSEAPDADAEPDLTTTRPLGSAPLLDSKPLPATMPGMLRPRIAEDFSLPAQRPAFEIGPEQPADR